MGNEKLVKEGIYNDDSDYRVHVCPIVKRIYCYPTEHGKIATDKRIRAADVKTKNIRTATGHGVPIHEIGFCRQIPVPDLYWEKFNFQQGEKGNGKKAEEFVIEVANAGILRYESKSVSINNVGLQRKGYDLKVSSDWNVQVKLDFKGGARDKGGTGNLFIQVEECNPEGIHT